MTECFQHILIPDFSNEGNNNNKLSPVLQNSESVVSMFTMLKKRWDDFGATSGRYTPGGGLVVMVTIASPSGKNKQTIEQPTTQHVQLQTRGIFHKDHELTRKTYR